MDMSEETPFRYTAALAQEIEVGWQERWLHEGTFEAPNPAGPWAAPAAVDALGDKLVVLDMFPYPSGAGLHVGHPLGYIATDVYSRFHRMLGRNVMHCLGFDAFGLPAEQYAVQTGQHPRKTTEENMVTMRRQLRRLGLGFDERRSYATIDPEYYRWTQWIFTQIWGAWYDPEVVRVDGGAGAARPISELVDALVAGTRTVPELQGRVWSDLAPVEQAGVLDAHRLAYTSEAPVNWCPGLGTVLSNEEVTNDGRSERGNYPVFRRSLSQWMMRITSYADRLADDLDRVDWPEKVKAMQRNWIGRSNGARVTFPFSSVGEDEPSASTGGLVGGIEVFTTRPDTIFGATFMVLAPEHPLVDTLVPVAWPAGTKEAWKGEDVVGAATSSPGAAVGAYRRASSRRSDVERQMDDKAKTGVFTGAFARNPLTGEQIPVFVADYVLMGYGTWAIMAVPAQDERDWAFAVLYDLPIVRTVQPSVGHPDDQAFTGDGPAINSTNDILSLDGLGVAEAKAAAIAHLEASGDGAGTVSFRLRDWLFSRQRYWGEPFPVVYDEDGVAHAVPDSMLPVELPDVPDYSPRTYAPDDADSLPEPPLSRVPEWVDVRLDLGDGRGERSYRRETNTMPNWAGSCWYYLRYLDPANHDTFVDPDNERYWIGPQATPVAGAPAGASDPGGVDLYVGGVEHAVLHLLYARFWHKVLYDLGHVSSEEPFRRYFSQGYIQAYAYQDARGQYVEAREVQEHGAGDQATFSHLGEPVQREYGKIGKSLKNSVSPDELYEAYGADTFRVYEMSMGPLELSKPWDTRAVVGAQRFLQRLWRNAVDEQTGELLLVDAEPDRATTVLLHKTIAGVRDDYESLRFNTALAKLIELNNAVTKLAAAPRAVLEPMVVMLAPLAPHIAEELWERLGHEGGVTFVSFPVADPVLLVDDEVTCVIQVKGKVRDRVEVPAGISEDDLRELVLAREKVVAATPDGIRTVIVRAPRLVNIVPI